MNATHAFAPLPRALDLPRSGAHRRFHIARHVLAGPSLDAFNQLRSTLDARCAPLDPDQLATAARDLCHPAGAPTPGCVVERLGRALVAVRAARDRAWRTPEPVVATLRRVVAYLRAHDDLIPDTLPTIGRLDDALVIDAAWPVLADEVVAYEDFRRLRARLRSVDPRRAVVFDRSAWLDLKHAQADADRCARQVRDSSYLAPPCGRFRVH